MKNNAITLISLVITIILLIILAGIGINLSIGENGLFSKAKYAKEETNKQTATEKINLKITTAQINTYSQRQEMPTLKELSLALGNDDEIAYVTEVSQIASTKYEVGEEPTSIFTKLKEYPYEFEINGKLQLASINGTKVANVYKNYWEDTIIYDGTNRQGNIITLSESAYNFKELLLRVDNTYIQVPIIQNETSILQGGVKLYPGGVAKHIIGVEANLSEDGIKLIVKSVNRTFSDQITQNYEATISKIIGRYRIK
ncbi:MAG: hypothetical protein HFJ42_04915 [Clostridia bacterium]|nr:hypothetical protein [Clostridia bacterium]